VAKVIVGRKRTDTDARSAGIGIPVDHVV